MLTETTLPVSSLYVHVPFCARKCEYCAFYSEASDGEVIQRYVSSLVRELEFVASDVRPKTIFFGGGTPSLLNLAQWTTILDAMGRLNLLGAAEWTVESNPATVSLDKARLWRERGINRVSMGVQSLDEHLLDRLGRVHSREMVFKSFDTLRKAGFENINVDLMFAIPGQTMDIWRATLDEAIALGSEHLSSYEVIYEEDTPLFQQLNAGEFSVDEDLACDMYDELVERSAARGFTQYEIANFARGPLIHDPAPNLPISHSAPAIPERACRHNVNYWRGGSYHGLGPSAAGYVRGLRTKNWSNTTVYCDQLEKGRRAVEWSEALTPLKRAGETAAFGLRMPGGWYFEQFLEVTGFDLRQEWSMEMERLVGDGWGHRDQQGFRLTPSGLRFADAAAELFLR
ncbi:MAG: coproporphyrinogen III oxidase family protein [Verrucomicrobia bacterium]|nr:coproporphyrinogen III oxidase family protein [Verrucomicrobiota bacterium]